ncbi:hypothetical protein Fot_11235 [Forsythia ovata]|uniref:Uncharacterized protein n=1 Tax=Forsythia ovata TaxID=205694 RepID=A0ABD1WJ36_9LAMI
MSIDQYLLQTIDSKETCSSSSQKTTQESKQKLAKSVSSSSQIQTQNTFQVLENVSKPKGLPISNPVKPSELGLLPTPQKIQSPSNFKKVVQIGTGKLPISSPKFKSGRWWEKFTETNSCPKSIQAWLENCEHQSKPTTKDQDKHSDFLTEKINHMAMLTQCKDPEEFSHLTRHAALAGTASNPSKASSSSSSKSVTKDLAQDNDDDGFGIDEGTSEKGEDVKDMNGINVLVYYNGKWDDTRNYNDYSVVGIIILLRKATVCSSR